MMATINPGDEVIITAPFWVSYPDIVLLAEGKPVIVECPESQNFKITPEQLEKNINSKTKWLMLNSPSNPTGSVYSKKVRRLSAYLKKHPNVLIMCDDIYEKIVYDGVEFHTLASIEPSLKNRCLDTKWCFKIILYDRMETWILWSSKRDYCCYEQNTITKHNINFFNHNGCCS